LRACHMLLSPTPDVLDQCSLLLETATKNLAACRPVPDDKPVALSEARQLHAAVRHATLLLDAAMAFHDAWARRLGAISGGYTARGEPAAVDRGFRLVVQG
jgi:hypothetical protein